MGVHSLRHHSILREARSSLEAVTACTPGRVRNRTRAQCAKRRASITFIVRQALSVKSRSTWCRPAFHAAGPTIPRPSIRAQPPYAAKVRCILANRQGRTRNVLTRRCPQMDNYRHARHSKDGLMRWDRVQSRRDPYPPSSVSSRPSRASRSPVRHLLVHKRGHLLGRYRCRAPTRCVLSA